MTGRAESAERALESLRARHAARAAGIWRRVDSSLVAVAHAFASDMDPRVANDFRLATLRVQLDQVGLAIVQAVNTRRPVVATDTQGPAGSSSWIVRFGAKSSFSVPLEGREGSGVLAIAIDREADDAFQRGVKADARSFLGYLDGRGES